MVAVAGDRLVRSAIGAAAAIDLGAAPVRFRAASGRIAALYPSGASERLVLFEGDGAPRTLVTVARAGSARPLAFDGTRVAFPVRRCAGLELRAEEVGLLRGEDLRPACPMTIRPGAVRIDRRGARVRVGCPRGRAATCRGCVTVVGSRVAGGTARP